MINSHDSDAILANGREPEPTPATLTLIVRPKFMLRLFLSLTAAWVVIHLGFIILRYGFGRDVVFGIANIFDLWSENTAPQWYSSSTLFLCGILLVLIAWATHRSGKADTRFWVGLALLFFFVSLDESIALHERLMKPGRELFDLSGPLYFAWVVPYGMAMLGLAAVYIRFLLRLPRTTRTLFFWSAAIFLGGAIGMEMIGAVVYTAGDFKRAVPIEILSTVEESMEMIGVAMFLYALASHLGAQFKNFRIGFGGSSPVIPEKE